MSRPQVFGRLRIYRDMGKNRDQNLAQVRCLNCRQVYDKPQTGSTVGCNPGCPECGYVGWLSVVVPVGEVRATHSA